MKAAAFVLTALQAETHAVDWKQVSVFLIILILIVLAVAGGWWINKKWRKPLVIRPQTRLELNKPEFQVRAQNFFNLMSLPEFQQQFLSDPGGVAAREMRLKSMQRSTISTANRLIYRLLSDANFNEWAKQFQQRIEAEFPTIQSLESLSDVADFVRARENKTRLMEEFSHSVVAHLAPDSYQDLLDQTVVNQVSIRAEPDIALVPLTFIAIIVVLVIAAGYGRPNEKLSRINLQLTINQLTPEQIQLIQARWNES